jgi:CheY-like chemotaxis protein
VNSEHKVDILIVDDDEGHIELIRRNLNRAGICNDMTAVRSGRAAIDFLFAQGTFSERTIDGPLLVLLDINMPGELDGIEVLRQLKADPLKRKIPVIMLTTTDDPREVERCYQLGCSVYITKPVDPGKFVESIHRLGLFIAVVKIPSESGEDD